ncbi:MAG TPA: hypothetical protein VGK58_10710, partial [Lacipirellulaceae bacterium]
KLGVTGPTVWQTARVIPAAVAMMLVLLPAWQSSASLLSVAIFGPLSVLVYFAVCIWTDAWPWSDVVQVWRVAIRPKLARRSAAVDRQPPSPMPELAAEVRR